MERPSARPSRRRGRPRSSSPASPSGSSRRRACCGCGSRSAPASTCRFLPRSSTVTSAGEPGASVPPGRPRTRAGFVERRATRCGSSTSPAPTSRSRQRATAVSRPTMPNAAWSYSTFLSSTVCGAWSVAMQSIVPSEEPGQHRLPVRLGAQRRVHLGVRVVAGLAHRLVGEEEVVRRHLGGDPHPARLAAPHGVDRGRRGEVCDVDAAAGELGEEHVALDHDRLARGRLPAQAEQGRDRALVHAGLLGQRRLLAVVDDRERRRPSRTRGPAASRGRSPPACRRPRDATQPASFRSPNSASSSPFWPRVIAPIG